MPEPRDGDVRSVVLITATEPEPRTFGKQVVLGGLLDHLRARLGDDDVHVVIVGRDDVERPETPYRRSIVPKPGARDQLAAALTRVPFAPHSSLQEAALWSPAVRDGLRRVVGRLGADLEIWDTMRVGQYARELPRRRRVLYADDLFSKRYESMLEQIAQGARIRNPLGEFQKLLPGPVGRLTAEPVVHTPLLRLERRLTARSERLAPAHFDATLLVNADEAAELRSITGDESIRTLLPFLPDRPHARRTYDGTPRFVFLGGLDYAPNRDGLNWFLETCRDEVLARVPDFELLVVGRGSEDLPDAAAGWNGRVRGLGWVEDLDAVLGAAAAMLSPLRVGSGTKIKVLEALSRGLPVVATRNGVLGLSVDAEDGCLVGDDPSTLARLIGEVVDPARNAALAEASRRTWNRRFSPAVVSETYDAVLGLGRVARR